MIFLDIVFQSGEFYNQGSTSWLTFFTSLTGAIIGTATALLVFYLQTKRDRAKDEKVKNEIGNNTLKYFSALLESILFFADENIKGLDKIVKDITEKPLDFHLLHTGISGDLYRIIDKAEHQQIFHAYVHKFGNTEERIKIFQRIFSRLDYLRLTHEQAIKSHEKYVYELTTKLGLYKTITEDNILAFCGKQGAFIKESTPDYKNDLLYNVINEALINYHINAPRPITVQYVQSNLVEPLKNVMVEKFELIRVPLEIADNCRKATWFYNETLQKSNFRASEFRSYHEDLLERTNELKTLVKDLVITPSQRSSEKDKNKAE